MLGNARNHAHVPISFPICLRFPMKILQKARIMLRMKSLLESRIASVAFLHRDCFQGDIGLNLFFDFAKVRVGGRRASIMRKTFQEAGDGAKHRIATFL